MVSVALETTATTSAAFITTATTIGIIIQRGRRRSSWELARHLEAIGDIPATQIGRTTIRRIGRRGIATVPMADSVTAMRLRVSGINRSARTTMRITCQ